MASRSLILHLLTIVLTIITFSYFLLLLGFSFKPYHNQLFAHTRTAPTPVQFWVTQHLQWHDENYKNPNTRKIVFRTIGAGLGDHVFALLAVYSYAVLTKRALQIDWTKPYPVSEILGDQAKARFLYHPNSNEVATQNWRYSYTNKLPAKMRKLLAGSTKTVVLQMGPGPWGDSIAEDLRGDNWEDVRIPPFNAKAMRAALSVLLQPSDELRGLFEKTRNELKLPKHYISVHARLGSGTNEQKKFKRFQVMEGREETLAKCFAMAVKRLAAVDNPTVFVASDTDWWRPIFKKQLRVVLPKARVTWLNEIPVHWRGITQKRQFLMQHVATLLIGHAYRVISFRSAFSRFGYWRGTATHYTTLNVGACLSGNVHIHSNETMA